MTNSTAVENWNIHIVGVDDLQDRLNEIDSTQDFGVANIIPPTGVGNDQWTIISRRLQEQPPMGQGGGLPPEVAKALQEKLASQQEG